ncbi:hypothetical protein ACNVED_15130 (plasmid) [Legionella sp. D16C41]|uniref:hypothetical protein n=1 Tax=Legionella sp. D16C41 TaxID=3402688 RepID=UPI003AF4A940
MRARNENKKATKHLDPTLHYLWVGSPTRDNLTSIAGHDIAGPIQMAKQLKSQRSSGNIGTNNPVKFWCLKEHLEAYQNEFKKEDVDIEVCAIEDLLEKESTDITFATHTAFITELLKTALQENNKKGFVALKDCFSLFLLATQGGYFLDTNVFPVADKVVNLPQLDEVKTARSGFQKSNDFFMMFSPKRGHYKVLNLFEAWKQSPGINGLYIFGYERIPLFDEIDQIDRSMGVAKQSYKSYYRDDTCGLFYWTEQIRLSSKEYDTYLNYGDKDLQTSYPNSKKILEECSLCYDKNPAENWKTINFKTDKAFISDRKAIYFVDKKTDTCVKIYDNTTIIHDKFPHPLWSNRIKIGYEKDLEYIINITGTNFAPSHIVNIDRCTILHQAVLLQDIPKIKSLLKAGADLTLKATYQVNQFPDTPIVLDLTAEELAHYVGHTEIVELFKQQALIQQIHDHIHDFLINFKQKSVRFANNLTEKAMLIEQALQRAKEEGGLVAYNSVAEFLTYKPSNPDPGGLSEVMSIAEALSSWQLAKEEALQTIGNNEENIAFPKDIVGDFLQENNISEESIEAFKNMLQIDTAQESHIFKVKLLKIRNSILEFNFKAHGRGIKINQKEYAPDLCLNEKENEKTISHGAQYVLDVIKKVLEKETITEQDMHHVGQDIYNHLKSKKETTYKFFGYGARDTETVSLYEDILSNLEGFFTRDKITNIEALSSYNSLYLHPRF